MSGIRLRVKGISRSFDPDGDPRGYPHEFDQQVPYLPPPRWQAILPYTARDSVDLSTSRPLLLTYPTLSSAQAIALVRAARSYQEALWIAESDARQAWLRLVGAVEAATQEWPIGRRPRRPMQRFIEFVSRFRPPRPRRRPTPEQRLDWTRIPEHMEAIYNLRSRDLHDGIPFPPPMCRPPYLWMRGVASEIPQFARQSTWTLADAPMMLHTFEYIVRRALQAWWDRMASGSPQRAAPRSGGHS